MRTSLAFVLAVALVLACLPVLAAETRAASEKDLKAYLVDKLGDDAKGINVTVVKGKATLTGEVKSRPVQELSKEVALAFPGVTKAKNEVSLKKEQSTGGTITSEFNDGELEGRVKRALTGEMGKRGWDVEVEAVEDWVSLRGTVPDQMRKDLALKTAQGTEGVKKVIDLITVAGK